MERLTARDGDMVYYRENECLLAPVNMSGFDVRRVLERLAELEDRAESADPVMVNFINSSGTKYRRCPKCGRTLFKDKFCGDCGQAVNMDGKK